MAPPPLVKVRWRIRSWVQDPPHAYVKLNDLKMLVCNNKGCFFIGIAIVSIFVGFTYI